MDIFERRRGRLAEVLQTMTAAELSRKSGVSASYISRCLKEPLQPGYKMIGEVTARKLEGGAKKPEGWLDANTATAHITMPMPTVQAGDGPMPQSAMAYALGQLFDMLPQDAVTRTKAYNRATEEILRVLQGIEDQPTHTQETSDPAQKPHARRLTDAHS